MQAMGVASDTAMEDVPMESVKKSDEVDGHEGVTHDEIAAIGQDAPDDPRHDLGNHVAMASVEQSDEANGASEVAGDYVWNHVAIASVEQSDEANGASEVAEHDLANHVAMASVQKPHEATGASEIAERDSGNHVPMASVENSHEANGVSEVAERDSGNHVSMASVENSDEANGASEVAEHDLGNHVAMASVERSDEANCCEDQSGHIADNICGGVVLKQPDAKDALEGFWLTSQGMYKLAAAGTTYLFEEMLSGGMKVEGVLTQDDDWYQGVVSQGTQQLGQIRVRPHHGMVISNMRPTAADPWGHDIVATNANAKDNVREVARPFAPDRGQLEQTQPAPAIPPVSASQCEGDSNHLVNQAGQNDIAQPTPAALPITASKPEGQSQHLMKQMPVIFGSSAAGASALRVVCYGDSLTAGLCSRGRIFEPYGRTLADTLGKLGSTSSVAVCGLVGKAATQMADSLHSASLTDSVGNCGQGLDRILVEFKPDLAIIMAGTNDLSRGLGPEGIFAAVKRLHEACHARGIATVALIPPQRTRGAIRKTQERVASLMIEWSRSTSTVAAIFDVEKLAPRKPAGQNWDSDEIHLSRAGQQGLGERLAERLACLPLLAQRIARASDIQGMDSNGSSTQQPMGRKRTLTGFVASAKTAALQPKGVLDLDESDEKERGVKRSEPCGSQMPADDSKHLRVSPSVKKSEPRVAFSAWLKPAADGSTHSKASTDVGAKSTNEQQRCATRPSVAHLSALPAVGRPRFCMSIPASDFPKGAGMSVVLRKIAEDLSKQLSNSTLACEHGMQTIGLSIACDGSGWSGHLDVSKPKGEGLSGEAIYSSLGVLAGRSGKSLGVNIDSVKTETANKESKLATIQCITGYLHARDPL